MLFFNNRKKNCYPFFNFELWCRLTAHTNPLQFMIQSEFWFYRDSDTTLGKKIKIYRYYFDCGCEIVLCLNGRKIKVNIFIFISFPLP